ncbi:hypothetical protein K501DRAFT_265378 [Backusella circina FSU 941]|nr:hypothetical protein K501DRAFT_265378 [Backusella circina FSU 941]
MGFALYDGMFLLCVSKSMKWLSGNGKKGKSKGGNNMMASAAKCKYKRNGNMVVSDAVCLQAFPFFFMIELLLVALAMLCVQLLLTEGKPYPTHTPGIRSSE